MSNYPAEFKDTMISKMTEPGGRSATSLGKEIGIAQSTLSRWLRERGSVAWKAGGQMRGSKGQFWSAEEKLAALLARISHKSAYLDRSEDLLANSSRHAS